MFLTRVNNWLSKFQKYIFSYKDGFWIVPCLSNSPDLMIETLAKMPFNVIDREKQIITTNNPFNKGIFHYVEIEKGLWLFVINLEFKANVCFKIVYDNEPSTYYSAGYFIQKMSYDVQSPSLNGVKYFNKSFSLNKPKTGIDAAYYKGTNALFITMYFDKNWLNNTILNNDKLNSKNLLNFINGDKDSIVWPELLVDEQNIHEKLNHLMLQKSDIKPLDLMETKIQTLELITSLFKKIGKYDIQDHDLKLNPIDQKKVQKAEKILLDSLLLSFPGIENIANEIGVSATKLKTDFKLFFGQTLFEYFQEKQMNYAKLKLDENNLKINQIASNLGYANASKFALTFKKIHGILPSEYQKNSR